MEMLNVRINTCIKRCFKWHCLYVQRKLSWETSKLQKFRNRKHAGMVDHRSVGERWKNREITSSGIILRCRRSVCWPWSVTLGGRPSVWWSICLEGAVFGFGWCLEAKCIFCQYQKIPKSKLYGRVRDVEFMVGACSEHGRIGCKILTVVWGVCCFLMFFAHFMRGNENQLDCRSFVAKLHPKSQGIGVEVSCVGMIKIEILLERDFFLWQGHNPWLGAYALTLMHTTHILLKHNVKHQQNCLPFFCYTFAKTFGQTLAKFVAHK